MNFAHTVVSKRKLTVLVDEKIVDGWDDPRLPTIRGLIRRGLTVEALKQFVTAHPGSRADVNIEWSSIWALNRKVIEPIAPKYFALEKPAGVEQPFVPIEIRPSFDPELRPISCHPANPDLGEKQVWFSPRILISQTDAAVINEGDVVTFMRWGNVKVSEVQKKDNVVVGMIVDLDLDNKNYKTTLKVTWLADRPENIPVKRMTIG
uniref:Uncharacterized protein n=1 Tax=Ditylenchus dipsaci TaxID=166011 RepID=A0A915ETR0_9BILA